MISTGSRACAFCQRGVGFTPVRCCHSLRAKRYVSGDRRRTRVIVAANRTTTVAWVMVLFQFVDIGLISASQQRIDSIIVVAVLRRTVNQPLTQLLVSQTVEVIRQCGSQLLLTNRALFKYQFLHCRQAVAEVSNADLQARNPVIFRAALLDTFRSLNTVIHQRRAENIVYVLFQHGVDDIFDFD